jgi:hypothetical protein
MFFFLSTEMLFKAITKQSLLWDRLFLALVLRKVNHCDREAFKLCAILVEFSSSASLVQSFGAT